MNHHQMRRITYDVVFCVASAGALRPTEGVQAHLRDFVLRLPTYLGRVYDEVRSRPLSIINTVHRSEAMSAPHFGMIAVQTGTHQNQEETDAA